MTAPVFNPADIHNHTYYVEDIANSTPEHRQCFFHSALWAQVGRPDGGPVAGSGTSRRFWANVPAEPSTVPSDDRYDARMEYEFVPYQPNPNDSLPPDLSYPIGERRERVVHSLKSKDELVNLVLQRQTEANSMLWPENALDQKTAEYVVLAQQSTHGLQEKTFMEDYERRVAGQKHNRMVMEDCIRAITAGEEFSLETGTATLQWVTSLDESAA